MELIKVINNISERVIDDLNFDYRTCSKVDTYIWKQL